MPRCLLCFICSCLALAACGGGGNGPTSNTIGGAVFGLAGSGLVLADNGASKTAIAASGPFTFAAAVAGGATYNVTVSSQPSAPSQMCAVKNASGMVGGSKITNVVVTCTTSTFTVGGTVSGVDVNGLALQNNGGSALAVTSGLFKFPTPIASGSTYAVTAVTQPTGEGCVISNGSGTVGSSDVTTVSVNCSAVAGYTYVANFTDGSVSQYAIVLGGALSPLSPSTVASGLSARSGPDSVITDPTGQYVYVANTDSTVSQYTIGTGGALTPMTPATIGAGVDTCSFGTASAVTIDPTGRYVYVVNGGGTLSQYTIGGSGALTAMSPATVAAGKCPVSITVDRTGHYVYVANVGDNSISQYMIGMGGALTPISPALVATGPVERINFFTGITADPIGPYIYMSNSFDSVQGNTGNTISQYAIGVSGALVPLSPATVSSNSSSIAVDPTGKYLFASDFNSNGVLWYSIGADGTLSTAANDGVTTGTYPASVAVDPTGQYVYVANYGTNNVSQYAIGSGGALTPMSPATVSTGNYPYSIAVTAAH